MKKQISTLLALTLTVSMFTGCAISKNPYLEEGYVPETTAPETTAPEVVEPRDLDAAYATYPADMVIATVNGEDVLWEEYFYHCLSGLMKIEQYGPITDFTADFGGMSYNDYLIMIAETNCIQYHALDANAKAEGIELSEEAIAAMDAQLQYDIQNYSPDGTEEGLFAYLADIYTSREMYEYFNYVGALYSEGFAHFCGAEGELVTAEEIQSFIEEAGQMSAKHILISTVDSEGKPLAQELKDEKLALAEQLIAELSTFSGNIDEKFDEMIAEYGEDPGMTYYTSGYCFGEGEMVPEFEEATKALASGEFTAEPVESSFGYHIILRGDVTPESIPMSQENPMNMSQLAAMYKYNVITETWFAEAEFAYADGFEMNCAEVFGK